MVGGRTGADNRVCDRRLLGQLMLSVPSRQIAAGGQFAYWPGEAGTIEALPVPGVLRGAPCQVGYDVEGYY